MAAYISVPRDLTKVKSKVAFNLTKRQLSVSAQRLSLECRCFLYSEIPAATLPPPSA